MKVAYQGEIGAYSEAAVLEHFGPKVEPSACPSFEAVFTSVENGSCDCGLIPIENSLAGSIHRNYDLLLENKLTIVAEHFLRVRHCLIAQPGVELGEIRRIFSHPQALAQCDRFLRSLPGVQIEPAYDTAGSVKLIQSGGDRTSAAVASARAAEVYEMKVLAEGIEDDPANFTRFLAIARQPVDPGPDAKTSVVFSMRNIPGSLYRALSVFALRDLDLTKIESRPLVGKPWEYFFYIDITGSTQDAVVGRALNNLGEFTAMLRVLGSYPCHRLKDEKETSLGS